MIKLTQRQKEVVDKFHALEREHGEGNIYVRYINDCWNVMFVIHKKGDSNVTLMLKEENKINRSIFNALEKKGLMQPTDINHNPVEDANYTGGVAYLGCRITI